MLGSIVLNESANSSGNHFAILCLLSWMRLVTALPPTLVPLQFPSPPKQAAQLVSLPDRQRENSSGSRRYCFKRAKNLALLIAKVSSTAGLSNGPWRYHLSKPFTCLAVNRLCTCSIHPPFLWRNVPLESTFQALAVHFSSLNSPPLNLF